FFLAVFSAHRYLHSFPTRRSSDLEVPGAGAAAPAAIGGRAGSRRGAPIAPQPTSSWPRVRASEANACTSVRSASCHSTFRPGCRSEEHTSELQSRSDLVCRLLLEK